MENSPAVQEDRVTVRSLLAKDIYKKRFEEILGGRRAGQFMASLVQAANSYALRQCEPQSIINAAVVAASLDLPIDKNLGFAHIVPYNGVASFQMGYKGFIQLALRSGQFKSMRDVKVNAEAFLGYDNVTGDPKIDWTKIDESKEVIGYAFAWRLVNGFEKIVYWTREQVELHAKRFSQAYKKKKADSPWTTDFDSMALKTVIKGALAKWAPLSLEMQQAIVRDESAQKSDDGPVVYADGVPLPGEGTEEPKKPIFTPPAGTTPTPQSQGDAASAGVEGAQKVVLDREKIISEMKEAMLDHQVSETKLFKYAVDGKHLPDGIDELWTAPTDVLAKLALAIPSLGKKQA